MQIAADLGVLLLDVKVESRASQSVHASRYNVAYDNLGRLLSQADRVICVGQQEPSWFGQLPFDVRFVPSWTYGNSQEQITLGGLISGLDWIRSRMGKNSNMLALPSNVINVPSDLAMTLLKRRDLSDLVFPLGGTRILAECGLWSAKMLDVLEVALGQENSCPDLTTFALKHGKPVEMQFLPTSFQVVDFYQDKIENRIVG